MRTPHELVVLTSPGNAGHAQETHVDSIGLLPTLVVNRLSIGQDVPPGVTLYRESGALILDDVVADMYASPEADAVREQADNPRPHQERLEIFLAAEAAWTQTLNARLQEPIRTRPGRRTGTDTGRSVRRLTRGRWTRSG
jgi:hypothetical protein